MKFTLTAMLCLCLYLSNCQSTYHFTGGAAVQALCGLSVLLDGPESVYLNPASTADLSGRTCFDLSGGQLSGLPNVFQPGLGMIKKTGNSTLGINLSSSGVPEFRHTQMGLSYARPVLKNLDLGMRFNGGRLQIKEYGSTLQLSFDVGFTGKINEISSVGMWITYPLFSGSGKSLRIPTRLVGGYGYQPNPKTRLCLEVEKIEDRAISTKLGIIYRPLKQFELRLGTDFLKTMIGWGIGYQLKNNKLLTSYTYHRDLGGMVGISFQWLK